jgi:exopolysaccharide biosynthesis protein
MQGAQKAALDTSRVFWIDGDSIAAPVPNPACYGTSNDAASLGWLLEDAAEVLNGQDTLFSTEVELYPKSKVHYYLDDSIFTVTWQQLINNYIYTFAEVKVSHPSQFRRYLAKNEFNSDYTHPVSVLAEEVNAVLASSADHYRGRNQGIVVYDGTVYQTCYSHKIDTCFVDNNGDLILVPAGQLEGDAEVQQFVEDNDINFSISFGPILVVDGVRCEPNTYYLGEIYDKYPRAALCQRDELHYIIVMANGGDGHWNTPTIHMFAEQIDKLGCISAYTLDGGRTATMTMQGELLNPRDKSPRWVSDIIYFGTAIPESE